MAEASLWRRTFAQPPARRDRSRPAVRTGHTARPKHGAAEQLDQLVAVKQPDQVGHVAHALVDPTLAVAVHVGRVGQLEAEGGAAVITHRPAARGLGCSGEGGGWVGGGGGSGGWGWGMDG